MTNSVTESILTVAGLNASIEGQQVVEDVSFEMLPVGVTALLGRNGVGKTSTLRAIMGLIERSGEVTIAGERVDREPTHRIVQRGVGYVPEDREVFASLTVNENLRLAERDSTPNRQLIEELFPDLIARAGQLAGTLSGGQQQMVSLARALVNDNRVLLVDEPTKGLAPLIVMDVAKALERAAQTVPVLLVEQNLQVVRMLADKAIVLEGGRVVYDGSAEELLGNEALTKELLGVA
ncbi:ABC transporter ATP-binding protein [Salinibacterium sp. SWN167]|uniref:ABC transporter ATP-binding protein n=1 Tax=Salinibacterium sp. SWN167 TaxID=2792054 RepID=UPI0018CF10BA|nr:ABC transporter ATP-binding protein [Salinibacterium sp. SWN167]MBH0084495.1 ABC transporter ATP-binding protein [Salinibacterium sp. SWN167]